MALHKVGGGTEPLIVTSNYNESTDETVLDHTWQEIYNAAVGGRNVLFVGTERGRGAYILTAVHENVVSPTETLFLVEFQSVGDYVATSADGYPAESES